MTSSRRSLAGVFLFVFVVLGTANSAYAIPAFARKYGLRCSACHLAWPILNDFGWRFKDNGYQLMNDRDAPIWQNPSYWPVAFRFTPNLHRENTNKVAVDTSAGPSSGEVTVTQHGFDLSGLDILSGGTLEKNISFLLVPSADETGSFGFESAWVRFDNLFHSPWVNVKFGKFELDNWLSEKRIISLSGAAGGYTLYHFVPPGDNNFFGQVGDNQLGLEFSSHSYNDHTRFSAALLSSNDGSPDLVNANSYTGYFSATQGFDLGQLGQQRIGGYAMIGQAPTFSLTADGNPVPGSSLGKKNFSREGLFGDFFIRSFDVGVYFQHGSDDKYFATSTPGNAPLPTGARDASWNGVFIEPHYTVHPQWILFQRSEFVRMSQQALPGTPSNFGDIDAYTFGTRWYPIMTSRTGLALHLEYSWLKQARSAPDGTDLTNNSLFFGTDFDF
jgi:hypothetical protein